MSQTKNGKHFKVRLTEEQLLNENGVRVYLKQYFFQKHRLFNFFIQKNVTPGTIISRKQKIKKEDKISSWDNPVGIYLFQVNNRNIRTRREIYSKLTKTLNKYSKTPELIADSSNHLAHFRWLIFSCCNIRSENWVAEKIGI